MFTWTPAWAGSRAPEKAAVRPNVTVPGAVSVSVAACAEPGSASPRRMSGRARRRTWAFCIPRSAGVLTRPVLQGDRERREHPDGVVRRVRDVAGPDALGAVAEPPEEDGEEAEREEAG